MLTVREESRQDFDVAFLDKAGQRFVPTTVRYRLDDVTDGETTELIAWTEIAPARLVEIIIPATANRILDDDNKYELRVFTVQSDYGTDNQLSHDETYKVRNLSGFQ
jgi:hypothetical protein